eukprot:m.92442 g.92442  ORF g.92442 m.92442 type:complete len:73 (+) comp16521_c0_seq10:1951-2169(+)
MQRREMVRSYKLQIPFEIRIQDQAEGMSALLMAIVKGRSRLAQTLLRLGANANSCDDMGTPAVCLAAQFGMQ